MTNTASHTATTTTATATAERGVRRATETKSATKTTELIAYLAVLVAIVITAILVGDGGAEDGADLFDARQAIEYITYLTIGYLVSRGLAKSGSREYYTA
ncbi:hypothetical protein GMA12_11635 [Kocuria sediminis]|uniref:Uncharacterized protein n=1 Tax=Kocuria sediminis TaxID=1038857 RepID=A0A6N8GR80_9MICC|nr:hypothetical protein [Kocuria sediminis]MUN63783.1 hypothetical protein [Kocuria sediminis]